MTKRSWKTSLASLASALGLAISQAPPDAMPHWLRSAGLIASVLGLALAGFFARDNDVSSEDVGLKAPALPGANAQPSAPAPSEPTQ
jgi:hypothetical protein